MITPKIYATGNRNLSEEVNVSYYIVEKDANFLDWLEKLVKEVLEIKDERHSVKYVYKYLKDEDGEEKGEFDMYIKEIEKMIDIHEQYGNNHNRLDLFYGDKRVFLTFHKSRETRKKFADFVRKTKKWVEVREVKELPSYVRKVIQ